MHVSKTEELSNELKATLASLIQKSLYKVTYAKFTKELETPSQFLNQVEDEIAELQDKADDVINKIVKLNGFDQEKVIEDRRILQDLKEILLELALRHLSSGHRSSALHSLRIFVQGYPSQDYHFQDMERSLYIFYMSNAFEFIEKQVLSEEKSLMSPAEEASLCKVLWTILMAKFRLRKYEQVCKSFIEFSEKPGYLQVLNTEFIKRPNANCHVFFTKEDVYIAVIISALICQSDAEIEEMCKLPGMEDFWVENPLLVSLLQSHYNKSIAEYRGFESQVYDRYVKCNYHVENSVWKELVSFVQAKHVLFCLLFVERITLKQLSQHVCLDESELLSLIISLLKLMNLKMVLYSSSDGTLDRIVMENSNSDYCEPLEAFSVHSRGIILQNDLLRYLS